MRKIRNPYVETEGYRCFGCAPGNKFGLHMRFLETEDSVICRWEPADHFQGYDNVLHGGIQATLMDEIASWFIFVKLGTSGVTEEMQVQYLKPVLTTEGTVHLCATEESKERRRAGIRVTLSQPEGTTCSTALCRYAIYPENVARRRLHYPGREAFAYPAGGESAD